MFNLVTEGVKKDIFLRNMKSYGLYDNAISLIPDIDYVKVKLDKKVKEGYYVTIIQSCQEAPDIIEYFRDRFNSRFKEKSKFKFVGFNKITAKGKDVTSIQFYFRMNMFDRMLCYKQ